MTRPEAAEGAPQEVQLTCHALGGGGTLIDQIERHAKDRPEGVFCHAYGPRGEERLTWSGLRAEMLRWAERLRRSGVSDGDIVLLFMAPSAAQYSAFFGAMALGAVPSFMPLPSSKQHPDLYWKAHRTLFKRIRPAAVIAPADHIALLGAHLSSDGQCSLIEPVLPQDAPPLAARPVLRLETTALLQHSSGTTGLKKGVALSHGAVLAQLKAYGDAIAITRSDVIVSWLPVYHDMGLVACTLLPVYLGATVVLLDTFEWLSRPALMFSAIEQHNCTLAWMPNFAFQHMARSVRVNRGSIGRIDSMRAFINCSEPCQSKAIDRFVSTFGQIGARADMVQICYAAAETVFAVSQTRLHAPLSRTRFDRAALEGGRAIMSVHPEESVELLSCGTPLAGTTCRIVEDGRIMGEGMIGEIVVSGASVFEGYYRDEELTNRKLIAGEYYTGDLGFFYDGELYVVGRTDDLVVVNGRNLMLHDLEKICNEVAGIKPGRCLAFGELNVDTGSTEIYIAAELQGAVDEGHVLLELRRALLQSADIAPRDIQAVPDGWLVKSSSGKMSRAHNAAKYRALLLDEAKKCDE